MKRQILSIILAAALCMGYLPTAAFAVNKDVQDSGEMTIGTSGLCEHHTAHDDNCGYAEGADGTVCRYRCEECVAVDTEPAAEGQPADPTCTCGATEGEAHDGNCPLYETPALICICGSKCTAETVNPDCPVCSTEGADLSACTGEAPEQIACTCETDDPAYHATTCPMYTAPENPECHCMEKCLEDAPNEWCDICGVRGIEACTGGDEAAAYANVVAEVNTTQYTSLDNAVAAAKQNSDSTLKLMRNVEVTESLNIDSGKFTIDLNGNTLSSAGNLNCIIKVSGNAILTITDSGDGGSVSTTRRYAIYAEGSGQVKIKGGSVSVNFFGTGIAAFGNSQITIDGGAVESQGTGIEVSDAGRVTVVSGLVSGIFFGGINVSGYGEAAISGGTVTGQYEGILVGEHGKLTMSGGTVGPTDVGIYASNSSQTTITGGSIQCSTDIIDVTGSVTLGLGANDAGATFPDGIVVGGNLEDMLDVSAGFFAGSEMIKLTSDTGYAADDAITDRGDITVGENTCEHIDKAEATCISKPQCATCGSGVGSRDPDNHVSNKWYYDRIYGNNAQHGKYRYCCDVLIASEDHRGGVATCEAPADCTDCGESYGPTNSSNHTGGTEIRDKVEASATQAGYTGDTYCLGCGMRIAAGTTIPKKEGGSDYSGSSGDDDGGSSGSHEEEFWEQVEKMIENAQPGNKVIARACDCDRMPAYVMEALLERGDVTLEIHWNSGDVITIPGAKALNEQNRIYYPLSYLKAHGFEDAQNAQDAAVRVNPNTGGPAEAAFPAIDNIPEATPPDMSMAAIIGGAERTIERTIPNAAVPEVEATTLESEDKEIRRGNTAGIWIFLAALVVGGGGYLYFRRRKTANE